VPAVRMLLAERHDRPRHVLDQLAGDCDAKVLKPLATNPALSAAQLPRTATYQVIYRPLKGK